VTYWPAERGGEGKEGHDWSPRLLKKKGEEEGGQVSPTAFFVDEERGRRTSGSARKVLLKKIGEQRGDSGGLEGLGVLPFSYGKGGKGKKNGPGLHLYSRADVHRQKKGASRHGGPLRRRKEKGDQRLAADLLRPREKRKGGGRPFSSATGRS